MRRHLALFGASLVLAGTAAPAATADSIGPIDFESYSLGDINGQQGWMKLNPLFDVAVSGVAGYPAAAGYGFGTKSLRASDAFTFGTFGDQTFSPGLASPAGEAGQPHFDATFSIGSATGAYQPGMHLSVSPDKGDGSRMSYLRFADQADGIHVFFDDVTDPGPVGTPATFNETDIATIDTAHAHTARFSIDFNPGPANDVVKIFIDGAPKITGTTWEDYYRYDPEQAPTGNQVPTVDKLLFRESGGANPPDNGNGYLIDNISAASQTGPPTSKDQCKGDGWKAFNAPRVFKNQGDCVSFTNTGR